MKKFTNFLISFALFITVNYINFDWTIYTKLGKMFYYPAWFVRSVLVWLFCPIFIPEYLYKKSERYKQVQKITNSPQFKKQISEMIKKLPF